MNLANVLLILSQFSVALLMLSDQILVRIRYVGLFQSRRIVYNKKMEYSSQRHACYSLQLKWRADFTLPCSVLTAFVLCGLLLWQISYLDAVSFQFLLRYEPRPSIRISLLFLPFNLAILFPFQGFENYKWKRCILAEYLSITRYRSSGGLIDAEQMPKVLL